jgi:protein-disulfide isomerase
VEKKTVRKAIKAEEAPVETTAKTEEKPKTDYWQVKLPKFRFHNSSLNVYLVFVLVVFAFLLGMLVNKVMYLENQLKTNQANAAANTNQQANTAPQPTAPPYEKVSDGHLPAQGDTNAKVTVVEFGDFQCPFCQQFEQQAWPQLNDNYVKNNKVRFIWRQFPLTSIHPNAYKAAEASECANEQNQFWPYHDLLYQNQTTWSTQAAADAENSFVDYAQQLGMNTDQFRSCIDTDKYKKDIDADMADGNAALVDGTPTFFINGFRVVGAVPFSDPAGGTDLKQPIETALSK